MSDLTRRQALRWLTLGSALVGLSVACQGLRPPPVASEPPTPSPAPSPAPAPAATEASRGPLMSLFGGTPVPPPQVFRAALDTDPDTLDPAGQTNPRVQNVVDYMVETLVTQTQDGKIAPALAQRWSVSDDRRQYTFSLRSGVLFHDGSALDAPAAKASLDRFLSPSLKVPLRAPLGGGLVDGIDVLDGATLRIRLHQPFELLLAKLASTETGIISPGHAAKFPDSYSDQPIGTGPYQFEARVNGESVTLKRFDNYWGQSPFYPDVQMRIVPEPTTRESLLLANQVDLVTLPPLADLPGLQRNPAVTVLLAPTTRSVFVGMDLTLPGGTPLAIKKARQALNYAVDRDTIIRTLLFGAATPMDAPVAPSLVGYSRTGPYGFDQNRARELLLEAGTPGLALKLLHSTGEGFEDAQAAQVAQAIADNLRAVKVDVELDAYDWPSFLAAINVPEDKGTAHMHLFWWMPQLPDASQQLPLFSRTQWPPSGLNTSHYANPQVDSLLGQAAATADDSQRLDLYGQAQKIIWDDAPWLFLWVPSFSVVASARVRNVKALTGEKFSAVYAEPAAQGLLP